MIGGACSGTSTSSNTHSSHSLAKANASSCLSSSTNAKQPPITISTTSSLPTNLSVQLPDKMTDPSMMASSAHDDRHDQRPLSGTTTTAVPSDSLTTTATTTTTTTTTPSHSLQTPLLLLLLLLPSQNPLLLLPLHTPFRPPPCHASVKHPLDCITILKHQAPFSCCTI